MIRLHLVRKSIGLIAIFLFLTTMPLSDFADPLPATQKQGIEHGFLVLRGEDGKILAVGDQTNVVERRNVIRARMVFRFRDGSIDDETTTFRQGSVFQLIEDHHIQKGPSFPKPLDVTINVPADQVTWIESSDGKEETKHEHMKLPPDLVNGMIGLVVQDFPAKAQEMTVSYLAVDSKPRVIKMAFRPDGEDKTLVGGDEREAKRFDIHLELGGIAGIIAPVIGKQPPDMTVWSLGGEGASTLVKMLGPLYENGPAWTMELTSPTWPS